ncbi:unnamed protein product [Aspergillus oryzae RIB40]|uniref:DNA, SC005 n=1 Tax=Aspergillus oryzae (strain ATCC 42149 / RIB 40) TaxID=510516 RepID=Q2UR86_ASPOR|nr:unnamed protein product [Aspergillus oryzae RIB40]BAE55929.1 unnamed protein product [Aspergillus oryzae RIB40]
MNNCTVWSAYSYCVKKYENSTSTQFTWTYCLRIDATEAGTVSECNYFTSINGYDAGGDCDTALWANLSSTASRAVCIGVGSKSAAATTTISTVSETATSTTVFMGPTQTGVVSGCQLFHTVVDGDDFPSIESDYGITLAQFYQLNPSIGSTCNTLWLGYAYCVKGPSSSATATAISSTASPNGHTPAGTVSNCNLYHTVVSGDSCDHIEITYGISFAQLYEWNPAIGSNCETLRVGYSICVAALSINAPTQHGIASDCNRYYIVMEPRHWIQLSDFGSWVLGLRWGFLLGILWGR